MENFGLIEVAPHLKTVFLYIEEEWNESAGGGARSMADRRLRLSELALGDLDKSTRQCAILAGGCYCEEVGRDSSQCSTGYYEESRWLLGIVIAPKGAQAQEIWQFVPDEIIQGYDRWKKAADLRRWQESMPSNY